MLETPTAVAVLETRRGKWSTATEIEVLMSISVTSRVLADTFGLPVIPAPATRDTHWDHGAIHNKGDSTVDLWDVPKDDPGSWDERDADLTRRIIPMLIDHASDEASCAAGGITPATGGCHASGGSSTELCLNVRSAPIRTRR